MQLAVAHLPMCAKHFHGTLVCELTPEQWVDDSQSDKAVHSQKFSAAALACAAALTMHGYRRSAVATVHAALPTLRVSCLRWERLYTAEILCTASCRARKETLRSPC